MKEVSQTSVGEKQHNVFTSRQGNTTSTLPLVMNIKTSKLCKRIIFRSKSHNASEESKLLRGSKLNKMGCVASRVDQKFSKKQSVKRLRKSTLYAEKLEENSFPARIPQRCTCRMAIMKEMGKELRRLSPEVEF